MGHKRSNLFTTLLLGSNSVYLWPLSRVSYLLDKTEYFVCRNGVCYMIRNLQLIYFNNSHQFLAEWLIWIINSVLLPTYVLYSILGYLGFEVHQ